MAAAYEKEYEKVSFMKKDRLAVQTIFQNLAYLNIDRTGLCV